MSKKIQLEDIAVMIGDLATTVEGLARSTKKGFDEVYERIHESERRTAQRIESVELRMAAEIGSMKTVLGDMHEDLRDHRERINALEDKVIAKR